MKLESHLTRNRGGVDFGPPPYTLKGLSTPAKPSGAGEDLPRTRAGCDGKWLAAKRSNPAANCRLAYLNHEAAVSTEIPVLAGSYLTPDEVAARFHVRRRTIERAVAAKRFPQPLRIGRCVRFPSSELEAYEKSGGVWPPKPSP